MVMVKRDLDSRLVAEPRTAKADTDVALLFQDCRWRRFCRELPLMISPTTLAPCHSIAGFDLFFPTLDTC